MEEKQIKALKKLNLSKEEIQDIQETDKRIDKGEKLFTLSKDKEIQSKQNRQVAQKPSTYNFKRKEKKVDNDKRKIIQDIINILECKEVSIVNPEREILFIYNERKFKITLSVPRTKGD